MVEQSYVLTPQVPKRAWWIVALVDFAGLVLLGLGVIFGKAYLIVPGVLGLLAVPAFVVGGVLVRRRVTTTVRLDDQRIMITSGGRTATAAWTEISDVSNAGQTIYLNRSDRLPPLKIDSPRGSGDPALPGLSRDLVARLDRSRGYRDL